MPPPYQQQQGLHLYKEMGASLSLAITDTLADDNAYGA